MASKGMVLAALFMAGHVNGMASAASVEPSDTPLLAPAAVSFSVGDKLKVSFYEALNNDAKWAAIGKVREPGPSFYLHSEISGEYTVAADWTISVPIIGNVVVAHRTATQVEASLAKNLERAIGHSGFVNVAITARKPLYIVGWVNKPGVYTFEPDMTPLNLVALAGGFKTTPADRWSTIEALRESAQRISALDRLQHSLAQYAVLKAEIDNSSVEPPQQLIDLAGLSGADKLIQQENAKRKPLVRSSAGSHWHVASCHCGGRANDYH